MLQFIESLLRRAKKNRTSPRRRRQTQFAPPSVEQLESRITPVIGGTVNVAGIPQMAALAGPGTNLDGVVSLVSANGNIGSGSELTDQRIILTAAHVIGQAPVNQTVTFNLQRGAVPVNLSIEIPGNATNQFVPTVANAGLGMAWAGGARAPNDIGLIVLRDPNALPGVPAGGNLEMVAPFSPFESGYPIVDAPAAIPQIAPANTNGPLFTMVGYGDTGLGLYGTISASGLFQINLAGVPEAGGNFTLNFTPQGVAAVATAATPCKPSRGTPRGTTHCQRSRCRASRRRRHREKQHGPRGASQFLRGSLYWWSR